ncbi:SDR family oxidoreductase [Chryseolinea sp. T2]|uniref:SDR family oxidoreductase n=1 Tax=Chryseolinea sp. T2 TaxID=3129255 RepID=UPI0030786EBC
MTDIKDKVILITGGSKGIGLGIATKLLEDGARVAITGRDEKVVQQATKDLNSKRPDHALGLVADVRSLEDQQKSVATITAKWGRLDVLVANAGVGHFGPIETLTEEQWHETIDTNLTGVFFGVKAALAELKKTKGYVITIASLAGTNFFAGGAAYNASKFGLVGFSQAMMLDVRSAGVKVTTIMPGSVASYFNGHEPSEADGWKIQPEDIGQIVADLLRMNPRTLPSKVEVRPTIPK